MFEKYFYILVDNVLAICFLLCFFDFIGLLPIEGWFIEEGLTVAFFGSKKRKKYYEGIARELEDEKNSELSKSIFNAADTQNFMKQVERQSNESNKRLLNATGGGNTAEAQVAAQGKTNQAVGNAMGNVAAYGEKRKDAVRDGYNQQIAAAKLQAANQTGRGWQDASQVFNTIGQGIKAITSTVKPFT